MIEDPENPSQSITPDGAFQFAMNEKATPVMHALREYIHDELQANGSVPEWSQAVNNSIEALLSGVGWLEHEIYDLRQQLQEVRSELRRESS